MSSSRRIPRFIVLFSSGHHWLYFVALLWAYVVVASFLGNLKTTTTTLSTTTESELQCAAQARPVNFVVVVSSTTPNKVDSRRPAIHKLQAIFEVLCIFISS